MRNIAVPNLADKAAHYLRRTRPKKIADPASPREYVIGGLKHGVKFTIPPNTGTFLQDFNPQPQRFRLPYPEIVLMVPKTETEPAVIMLASEIDDSIALLAVIGLRNRWEIVPVYGLMKMDQPELPRAIELGATVHDKKSLDVTGTMAVTVMRFLMLLATRKIGVRVFEGVGVSVNHRRQAHGKSLISTHRVLEIKVPGVTYERKPRGLSAGTSPDPHMRRGHWRHLTSGRIVWVQRAAVRGGGEYHEYQLTTGERNGR